MDPLESLRREDKWRKTIKTKAPPQLNIENNV